MKRIFLFLFLCSLTLGVDLKPPAGSQLEIGHPLSNGLVGCWLMNEGGGNKIFDLSGNGNNGTLGGNAVWSYSNDGPCILFDGSSYIHTTMKAINSNEFTLLVKCTVSTNDSSLRYCIHGQNSSTSNEIIKFQISTDDSWYFYNDYSLAILPNVTPVVDLPYLFCGVFDYPKQRGSIFIDGQKIGTDDTSFSSISGAMNDGLTIGARTTEESGWKGTISYVYVYNRALTANEITQLYREPFCMFEQDDISLWQSVIQAAAQVIIINMM